MKYLFALVMILASSTLSHATEEGILPFSKFSVTSEGIGAAGPVTVAGASSKGVLKSLTVTAFGKVAALSAAQLAELDKVFINGLQLSYDHGARGEAGKAVYIQVARGFSFRTAQKMIVVKENGSVTIQ